MRPEFFNYQVDDGHVVTLSATVPVISCSSCGEHYSDDRAEDLRHEAVCRFLGRLTPSDLKSIRGSYGYSQAQWSELTGIGIASIKRWENGNQIQGLAFDRYFRILRSVRGLDLLKEILAAQTAPLSHKVFRTSLAAHALKDAAAFQLRIERAAA
jgi:DNA-binding transcriptional regulator YiaG